MPSAITQAASGIYCLLIEHGSNHLLPSILNRDVPWVWILGHRPNRIIEWFDTRLPLSRGGEPIPVRARDVSFDLVFRTEEFLQLHAEFLDHGIALFQSTKPMPDTLLLDRIDEVQVDQVLKQNGVYLHFHLPHAYETCEVRCWDRNHLEKIQAEL